MDKQLNDLVALSFKNMRNAPLFNAPRAISIAPVQAKTNLDLLLPHLLARAKNYRSRAVKLTQCQTPDFFEPDSIEVLRNLIPKKPQHLNRRANPLTVSILRVAPK